MSPPFPSDNNSELEFLEFAWQLELEILDGQFIQSSPPTASSSSFPSLDTPATYNASRTTSSRSQSTHHATSRQDDYRLLYNASPADNQSADPPYLHPGGQHTASFPSLGPPATYSHLPITSSWSQPPSYATLWQDNYRSQSQSLADNQSAHSSHLHPGGQHTSNFPSLGTPAIYNPFPTTLSRSQSTSHATPLQDDYRPLYNTSQSQPPADNRYDIHLIPNSWTLAVSTWSILQIILRLATEPPRPRQIYIRHQVRTNTSQTTESHLHSMKSLSLDEVPITHARGAFEGFRIRHVTALHATSKPSLVV